MAKHFPPKAKISLETDARRRRAQCHLQRLRRQKSDCPGAGGGGSEQEGLSLGGRTACAVQGLLQVVPQVVGVFETD